MRVVDVLGKFAVVAVKSVVLLPYILTFLMYSVDAAKRFANGQYHVHAHVRSKKA